MPVKRINGTSISEASLDEIIAGLVNQNSVHGLSIAVLNNSRVVFKKTYGYSNAGTKDHFKSGTVIHAASLSKPVFAAIVLKLAEEQLIHLDTPLYQYLESPSDPDSPEWYKNFNDIASHPYYKKVTARMCLSHTSGLSSWRWFETDKKLKFRSEPGSTFFYSGEGYILLQLVLEKITGQPLESLAREKIFLPAGMNMSSFIWQQRFDGLNCYAHDSSGKITPKGKKAKGLSGGSLQTTITDYSLFEVALLTNKLCSPFYREEMFLPQLAVGFSAVEEGVDAAYLSTGEEWPVLYSALGWLTVDSVYGKIVFKEGHEDAGWQSYTAIYPDRDIAIIVMTNSCNAEFIYKDLLDAAVGDNVTPFYWDQYISTLQSA
jgi:serine-type D-Ala-D-Ala carboxypeptidase/endopeptidase